MNETKVGLGIVVALFGCIIAVIILGSKDLQIVMIGRIFLFFIFLGALIGLLFFFFAPWLAKFGNWFISFYNKLWKPKKKR